MINLSPYTERNKSFGNGLLSTAKNSLVEIKENTIAPISEENTEDKQKLLGKGLMGLGVLGLVGFGLLSEDKSLGALLMSGAVTIGGFFLLKKSGENKHTEVTVPSYDLITPKNQFMMNINETKPLLEKRWIDYMEDQKRSISQEIEPVNADESTKESWNDKLYYYAKLDIQQSATIGALIDINENSSVTELKNIQDQWLRGVESAISKVVQEQNTNLDELFI